MTDYSAIIEQARSAPYGGVQTKLLNELADAIEALERTVEALVAENYDLLMQVAKQVPEGYEHVGWCWPSEMFPEIKMMALPNDGYPPPPRKGLRPMFAPVDA